MGRVWEFLNQDADTAIDRVGKPYVGFILSHRPLVYGVYAAVIAAVWIFFSMTVALLLIALWVVATSFVLAVAIWRRRS